METKRKSLVEENKEEEREHTCPKCGSTNTRYFFDIERYGDVEGWLCEDCGYEGVEKEFIE